MPHKTHPVLPATAQQRCGRNACCRRLGASLARRAAWGHVQRARPPRLPSMPWTSPRRPWSLRAARWP